MVTEIGIVGSSRSWRLSLVTASLVIALAPRWQWSPCPGAQIPNDVNGDGAVNSRDATFVASHLLGWEPGQGEPDCNREGQVDIGDLVHLVKFISSHQPDPVELADPQDPTVVSDLTSSSLFLYWGDDPPQKDVTTGTLESRRIAVLRGRVLGRDDLPLEDVSVSVLNHPEFGYTLSRVNGLFDMAVNGGGLLTVQYSKDGVPFIVAGYGSTLDWPPPVITDGDGLRRFAYSDYLALSPGWLYTLMNLATGNGGTGYGDSGGPAFWVEPDGTLMLVALTGHGDPNLVATNIAWRVDIPETLDFIDWVIDSLEGE